MAERYSDRALLCVLPSPACWSAPRRSADVTIAGAACRISGAGMMKMANMSGTTTTVISGDRARTDSNLHVRVRR